MGGTEGRGGAAGTLDIPDLIRDGDLCSTYAARSGALALFVNTRGRGAHRKTLLSGNPRGLQSHPQPAPRRRLWYLCETTIESVPARLCGSILAPAAFDHRTAHRENPQELTTVPRRLAAQNPSFAAIYRSDNSCRSFVRASLAQRHIAPAQCDLAAKASARRRRHSPPRGVPRRLK